MDLVLEVLDTYLFDWPYAKAFPSPPQHATQYAAFHEFASNATYASPTTNWQYRPATQMISFTPSKWAYLTSLPRDDVYRQSFSLFIITWIFGLLVYFLCGTLSYLFVFDKSAMAHPKFLKNQIRMEICQALQALPIIACCTVPAFLLEVRGHSKMYDTTDEGPGMWYNILQFPLFIGFTDLCIYWIHRGLHHPLIYKRLHKPHHKWIMPTPYASHAFHPLDGFAQSVPYHVFPFIFPLQKFAYVFLFVFINIWTVIIHDGEYVADSPVINGAACHTMHHLYFNYNYGQFTTLWDRLGGSYRKPNDELFRKELKMCNDEWMRQAKEMEKIVKEVEGDDDRSYDHSEDAKKTQ